MTEQEIETLKDSNQNWTNILKRRAANQIFAIYNGKKVSLTCGGCVQILRNWVVKQIA